MARLMLLLLAAILIAVKSRIDAVHLPETWDEQLTELLKEMLENLRNEMPKGIPSIDMPVLDPLIIPQIKADISDPIAVLTLRIAQLKIEGLSSFSIQNLRADLDQGFVRFDLTLPTLVGRGKCYINGKFIKIFPIYGDGDFTIHVSNLLISGYAHLNFEPTADTNLSLEQLLFDINFDDVSVSYDNLMGGKSWSKSLMKLLNGLGGNLFLHFKPEILKELTKAVTKLANRELSKGTLSELLDKIPLPPMYFIDMLNKFHL